MLSNAIQIEMQLYGLSLQCHNYIKNVYYMHIHMEASEHVFFALVVVVNQIA